MKPLYESEIRTRLEIEGEIFELTCGTDDLAECPGRIGLWVRSSTGSGVKIYFDDTHSIKLISNFFGNFKEAIDRAFQNDLPF